MRIAASVFQMALMAAIVATLLYWPAGVVAGALLGLLGVPIDSFVTFGGAINRFAGLAAWWLIAFAAALAYASVAFPWAAETRGFGSHE